MDGLRTQFENEVRLRLLMYSTGECSDEEFFCSILKQFDKEHKDVLYQGEYTDCLIYLGLPRHIVAHYEEFYEEYYGADDDSDLDIEMIAAMIVGQSAPKLPRKLIPASVKNEYQATIASLRDKLGSLGERVIIRLVRQFKSFDVNNSKKLSLKQFSIALKDNKVQLKDFQIQTIFRVLDTSRLGTIDYDELLSAVRGQFSASRIALINQAFNKLDTNKSGVVHISELFRNYSAKGHPDVKSGKITEDEILSKFKETFEMHHNGDDERNDPNVTKQEFKEYYSYISIVIQKESFFKNMMTTAWKLVEAKPLSLKAVVKPKNPQIRPLLQSKSTRFVIRSSKFTNNPN